MNPSTWKKGAVASYVVIAVLVLIAIVAAVIKSNDSHHPKPVASFYCYNVGGKKLTGHPDIVCNAKASKATKGHKIETYTWNFVEPHVSKKANTVPTDKAVASHTYHHTGDFNVTLTVEETITGRKDTVSHQVNVTSLKAAPKSGTPANPKKVALGDPGPGRCLPGADILANLRKQNLTGQDFKPPYSKYELTTLTYAEATWVRHHETEKCVRALAASYKVTPANLPAFMLNPHHLVLKVVGPRGLTVQNSYFNHTTGAIVWWQVQTFPKGELVWFSAKGVPQMKFVCGNRLRPVHMVPVKKASPHKAPPKKTVTKTVPPKKAPPKKTVPMCYYLVHKPVPVPKNGLCKKYDSSEPSTVPTQAQQHHPASDNQSEISRGPVKPVDSGNGVPKGSSPRSTPKAVATDPAPTSVSNPPAVSATPTAAGTAGTHGP